MTYVEVLSLCLEWDVRPKKGSLTIELWKFHDFPWPKLSKCTDQFILNGKQIASALSFSFIESLLIHHDFPWFSSSQTWILWLSRFLKRNYKIPWLSRFFRTHTHPGKLYHPESIHSGFLPVCLNTLEQSPLANWIPSFLGIPRNSQKFPTMQISSDLKSLELLGISGKGRLQFC